MNPEIKRLHSLIDTFYRDIEIAKTLQSPNSEDDLAIKAAIVGFSYHSPTEEWDRADYEYVKRGIDREYSDSSLEFYGVNGDNVRLFYC